MPLTDEVGTEDPDPVDNDADEDTDEDDSETGGRNGTLVASLLCTAA